MLMSFRIHISAFSLEQEHKLQSLEAALALAIRYSGYMKELSHLKYDYQLMHKTKPYDLMIMELNQRLSYVRSYTEPARQPKRLVAELELPSSSYELTDDVFPESGTYKRQCKGVGNPSTSTYASSSAEVPFPEFLLNLSGPTIYDHARPKRRR